MYGIIYHTKIIKLQIINFFQSKTSVKEIFYFLDILMRIALENSCLKSLCSLNGKLKLF